MGSAVKEISRLDPLWRRLINEAKDVINREPLLGGLVHSGILHHERFENSLSYRIALKLSSDEMPAQLLREIVGSGLQTDTGVTRAARVDLIAFLDRDPACSTFLQPMLFYKGYQALQAYRISHWLWHAGRRDMAHYFQMRSSEVFGVDIHPAACIGQGVMFDHAHGIVIGETAAVGNDASIMHSVTLGGTGKEDGDRHPKIRDGVLIGAGAKVLGNIVVGRCSRVAAGSVVLREVPEGVTVAGVPAKVVGEAGCTTPSQSMDHMLGDLQA